MEQDEVRKNVCSTFASVATSLGYSEVHGRVVAALMAAGDKLSLQEISSMTSYAPSSVSASLDLLELVGIVKKVKTAGDRKVYARLDGDLIATLRNAFLFKVKKETSEKTAELQEFRSQARDKKTREMLCRLEAEIQRLDAYLGALEKVEVPRRVKGA